MVAVAASVPVLSFRADGGLPLVGGLLYTYLTGTSTPSTTWQDAAQLVPNTNPIVLDARGECRVMLDPVIAYRFVLRTPLGVQIWSADNIQSGSALADLSNSANVALGDALVAVKQPVVGAVATTQHELNARELWLEDFGALPNGSDCTGAWALAMTACAALGRTKLRIGRGVFAFASAITLGLSSITVEGAGPGATVLRSTFDGTSFMQVSAGGTLTDVHLAELTLEQQVVATPTQSLLSLVNLRRWSVRNVAFTGGFQALLATACAIGRVEGASWDALAWGEGTRSGGFTFSQCTDLALIDVMVAVERTGSIAGINAVAGLALDNCTDVLALRPRVSTCRRGINLPNGGTRIAIVEPNVDGCQYGIVGDTVGATYRDVSINGGTLTTDAAVGAVGYYGVLLSGATVLSPLVAGVQMDEIQAAGSAVAINGSVALTGPVVSHNRLRGAGTTSPCDISIGFSGAMPTGVVVADNSINPGTVTANSIDVTTTGGAITGNAVAGGGNCSIRIRAGTLRTIVQGNTCLTIVDDALSVTNVVQGLPIAFAAKRSAPVTVVSAAGGLNIMPLNSETFDTYGTFDAVTLYRWVPGVAGLVQLSGLVEVQNNTGGNTDLIALIHRDGVEIARGGAATVPNGGYARLPIAAIDRAASSSNYQLVVYSSAAGNLSVQASSALGGVVIDR